MLAECVPGPLLHVKKTRAWGQMGGFRGFKRTPLPEDQQTLTELADNLELRSAVQSRQVAQT